MSMQEWMCFSPFLINGYIESSYSLRLQGGGYIAYQFENVDKGTVMPKYIASYHIATDADVRAMQLEAIVSMFKSLASFVQ